MQIPKWFYIVVAVAALIFSVGSALRSVASIESDRFSYYTETNRQPATVFDRRNGTACQWSLGENQNPNIFACLDYANNKREVWREKVVRHFTNETPDPFANVPMDTTRR